jgi:ribosome-binding protein aMBF1 (putative translation factor)
MIRCLQCEQITKIAKIGLCKQCYISPNVRKKWKIKLGLVKPTNNTNKPNEKPTKPTNNTNKPNEKPINVEKSKLKSIKPKRVYREMTMEQLDQLIAERYPTMPGWNPNDE